MSIPYVSAVIVAAGSSNRMGRPKQAIPLLGKPVLAHTLLAFDRTQSVGEIIVVTRDEDRATVQQYIEIYGIRKVRAVVVGGATRQQSVQNGVALCGDYPLIAIHDGARPLITTEGIERVAEVARVEGAAAAAMRAVDTVKIADKDGYVAATPDRATVWHVQTPQIFAADNYRAALRQAVTNGGDYTDDCQLMEKAGHRVRLIETGSSNFKVTVPEDVALAAAILTERGE